jgi:succinate dehydrogenase / fumarate reductase cytochrome b subunit
MSATAAVAPAGGVRALRFWGTTNGKKVVMAVSGVTMALFVFGHLAGNLQIFLGPDQFNGYARTLRHLPEIVWPTRIILLIMLVLHVWSSLHLAVLKSEARPTGYARHSSAGSSYASRTMYWSGPIVGAFIVYHLMEFTFGVGGTPYHEFDAYGNVIQGFRVPAVSLFYIFAMLLLCLHLRHGLWSMFQTLGFYHPRHTPRIRRLASAIALFVFLGFISIPLAVMLRIIPQVI